MTLVVILFVCAIMLIFAEIFLPGGVLGVIGVIALIASITVGWMRYPDYGFFILLGELVVTVVAIVIGIRLITRTGLRRHFTLLSTQQVADGYTSPIEDHAPVGTVARVHSSLRPAGSIMVDNYRVDAVSDGSFIDAGKMIRVVEVAGNRVVVEEIEDEGAEATA